MKDADNSREGIISNIPHWKSCPKYFGLLSHHIKLTEHGLFKCSKFGFLINFQCQYPRMEEKVKYINIIIEKTVTKPVLL